MATETRDQLNDSNDLNILGIGKVTKVRHATHNDNIADYIDFKTSGVSGNQAIFDIRDYGAIIDGYRDPDTGEWLGTDNTDAIQAAVDACFASGGGIVYTPYVPGFVTLLRKDPHRTVAGQALYAQVYVPLTSYDADGYPRIIFKGDFAPNFDAQGIISVPVSTEGSCWVSTWRQETYVTNGCVLGMEYSQDNSSIFTEFNYTAASIVGMSILTTQWTGSTPASHFLAQVIWEKLSQVNLVDDCYIGIDEPAFSSVEPKEVYGMWLPREQNHAVTIIGHIRVVGCGIGIEFGEHTTANYVLVLGCKVGIRIGRGYGVTINHLCTENNAINVSMRENAGGAHLDIGIWEGENNQDVTKWYYNYWDITMTGGGDAFLVTIGQTIIHGVGGTSLPLKVLSGNSTYLKVVVLQDEFGVRQIPVNTHYTKSRIATIGEAYSVGNYTSALNLDSGEMEYKIGTTWCDNNGTVRPTFASRMLNTPAPWDSYSEGSGTITKVIDPSDGKKKIRFYALVGSQSKMWRSDIFAGTGETLKVRVYGVNVITPGVCFTAGSISGGYYIDGVLVDGYNEFTFDTDGYPGGATQIGFRVDQTVGGEAYIERVEIDVI